MSQQPIPELTDEQRADGLRQAAASTRRRYPRILHAPGAVFNEVFNFMLPDSYMQPHLHPGDEKIEHIHLVQGRLSVLFFDDAGNVTSVTTLQQPGDLVVVPAFTWHTYVIQSDETITYETMNGQYEPQSWKEMAAWAPAENHAASAAYLQDLKKRAGGTV